MPPRIKTFGEIRARACQRVVDYLRSKSNGAATAKEINYFVRTIGMTGMTDAILDWLEQAGTVRYERDVGAIYYVPGSPSVFVPTRAARADAAAVRRAVEVAEADGAPMPLPEPIAGAMPPTPPAAAPTPPHAPGWDAMAPPRRDDEE